MVVQVIISRISIDLDVHNVKEEGPESKSLLSEGSISK